MLSLGTDTDLSQWVDFSLLTWISDVVDIQQLNCPSNITLPVLTVLQKNMAQIKALLITYPEPGESSIAALLDRHSTITQWVHVYIQCSILYEYLSEA